MTATVHQRPVSVAELRRAWHAVQDGRFRGRAASSSGFNLDAPTTSTTWTPAGGEEVLVVLGCAGSVGATTVAVAIGSAVEGAARVVECAPLPRSGLAAACDAELGVHPSGWVQGTRGGRLVLLRRGDPAPDPADVPLPPETEGAVVTVVDAGLVWPTLHGSGWVSGLVGSASQLVLVGRLSVPGLRQLEGCLDLLGTDRVAVAVGGPPRSRWPRQVACTAGPLLRRVEADGRLVCVPWDRQLALQGVTAEVLPRPVLAAGRELLGLMKGIE